MKKIIYDIDKRRKTIIIYRKIFMNGVLFGSKLSLHLRFRT